jgi:hypothetical protein
MRSPNSRVISSNRVVSTTRFKNQSEETFMSQNTIFSSASAKGNTDDNSDEKLRWEYFKFCFGFSMSCTMIVLAIFYSPILTSQTIGGCGSGAFYVSFALCSIGGAKFVVNYIGVRKAILFGHCGSSLYVALFLLMTEFLQEKALFHLNIAFAIVGGASQAIMWAGLVCTRVCM